MFYLRLKNFRRKTVFPFKVVTYEYGIGLYFAPVPVLDRQAVVYDEWYY
jgi:hypothetical protein